MEYRDTVAFDFSKAVFKDRSGAVAFASSPVRPIPGSQGLSWAIHVYKGKDNDIAVFFWISQKKSLTVKGTCNAGPENRQLLNNFEHSFNGASNNELLFHWHPIYFYSCIVNNIITITATFTNFDTNVGPIYLTIDDFTMDANHCLPDAKIVVVDNTIEVHRHFLCMISPVFQAEFTHDTQEAKTNTIKITDFEFKTVENVINYCYGRGNAATTLLDRINMLRFADKYDISTVIKKLEPRLHDEVNASSFCEIAQYAWDCERAKLQLKCAQFYKENISTIGLTPNFINMDGAIILGIIRAAGELTISNVAISQSDKTWETRNPTAKDFITDSDHYDTDAKIVVEGRQLHIHRQYFSMISPYFNEKFTGNTKESRTGILEVTDFDFATVNSVIDCCYGHPTLYDASKRTFDMLRFASRCKIQKLLQLAEQCFCSEKLITDNFCPMVQYAWEFEKADLKLECAAFCKDHPEIMLTSDFVNLDPSMVIDIMRAATLEKENGKLE